MIAHTEDVKRLKTKLVVTGKRFGIKLILGEFLESCSLIIMEHCSGASGPIWGSEFRGAGKYTGNASDLSLLQYADMIQASIVAIQKRIDSFCGLLKSKRYGSPHF